MMIVEKRFVETARRLLCCLVAVVTISSSTGLLSAQSVTLNWKWKKGDTVQIKTDQENVQTLDSGDQETQTSTTTSTWMTWTVKDVDENGVGVVESVISRMVIDTGTLKYDSDSKRDNPALQAVAKNLKPMINSVTSQKISPRGSITDVVFSDDMARTLKSLVGPNTLSMMEELSKNSTLEFPEGSLEPGRSWSRSVSTGADSNKIKVKTTYTYIGEKIVDENTFHRIDVDLNMTFSNPAVDVKKQSAKGTIFFDAKKGRIDHSSVKQEMEIVFGGRVQKVNRSFYVTFSTPAESD